MQWHSRGGILGGHVRAELRATFGSRQQVSEVENKSQKQLAIIFCVFIALMWKVMVFDRYQQHAQGPAGQTPGETGQPGSPPTSTVPGPTQSIQGQQPPNVGQTPSATAPAKPVSGPSAFPSDSEIAAGGLLKIETAQYKAQISLLGGRFTSFLLKNYRASSAEFSEPLNLIEHSDGLPYPLGVYSGDSDDTAVKYQVVSAPQSELTGESQEKVYSALGRTEPLVFRLQGTLPDGRTVTKTISFPVEGYLIGADASVSAPAGGSRPVVLEWTELIKKDSATFLDPYNTSGFTWFNGTKADRRGFGKLEAGSLDFGNVVWAAMSDKYFMEAMLEPSGRLTARAVESDELFRLQGFGGETNCAVQLFLGPKSLELLQNIGYQLQLSIDFGRTGFIAAPLLMLLHLLYSFLGNWGLAIVGLTIIVKTLLYPLAAASYRQMKAMQELQPEVMRIRETVQDQKEQNTQIMALYSKRGVNPLGGCLPILVQMPVFIGLYSALMLSIELRHAHFAFWISDLSARETLHIGSISVPVMVILFVVTMLVQQWTTPTTMDRQQRIIMLIMPLMFGFMFASMPAGLTLYWLTNNLISIGQQKAFQRKGKHSPLLVTVGSSAAVFALVWAVVLLGRK